MLVAFLINGVSDVMHPSSIAQHISSWILVVMVICVVLLSYAKRDHLVKQYGYQNSYICNTMNHVNPYILSTTVLSDKDSTSGTVMLAVTCSKCITSY